ncbi:MAG: hypothetical protein SGJ19_05355, partial [Planctomycetia bacterium]|nr:hypothetical protein [Planctomycetia bacterium]
LGHESAEGNMSTTLFDRPSVTRQALHSSSAVYNGYIVRIRLIQFLKDLHGSSILSLARVPMRKREGLIETQQSLPALQLDGKPKLLFTTSIARQFDWHMPPRVLDQCAVRTSRINYFTMSP